MHDRVGLLSVLSLTWVAPEALNEPPARALPRVGNQKHLQVGVREDNCPDVTTVDHNVT